MKKIFSLLLMCIISIVSQAQDVKIIKLKRVPVSYSPQNYYITKIVDERTDTTTMGTMKAGLMGKVTPINLQGGTATGLMNYINSSVKQDESKTAVELHLKKFEVSEQKVGMTPQVDLVTELGFYADGREVYTLQTQNYAQGGYDVSAFIGKLIQQCTEYFLKNVDEQLMTAPAGQSGEVEIKLLSASDKENQLVYSKSRPLMKEDFAGRADDLSKAAAATASGIQVKYSYQSLGTKKKIKITVLTYFDKTASWWKYEGKTEPILAHEQLHFDITAIFTCEMIEALRAAELNASNLEQEVERIHADIETRRADMQHQYDKETVHGSNAKQQAVWAGKIKAMLAEKGMCFD